MKTKMAILGILAIIGATLIACAGAQGAAEPKQMDITIPCEEFAADGNITSETKVAVGDTIKITLCSNATTGFKWSEAADISDDNVLEQMNHEYIGPAGDGIPLMGAPGKEVWTFKSLEKGTAIVSIEYSRPWEGGEQGVWTFVLTVEVE